MSFKFKRLLCVMEMDCNTGSECFVYRLREIHVLGQTLSTRSSRATCSALHSVTLPAATCQIKKKSLITLSLAKPRENTEANWTNYDLFIYGEIHYVNNIFCTYVLKIARHSVLGSELRF
jgi:hypothetical protein